MSFKVTLHLQATMIQPGVEWPLTPPSWRLLQVLHGVGYCISGINRRELVAGEAMLASPKAAGVIRASQLGELGLQFFDVVPELLGGVLTVGERHYLDDSATLTTHALTFIPADAAVAREFQQLGQETSERLTMVHRCRLLALFARAFPVEVCARLREASKSVQAAARFENIIGRMSEQELLNHSTGTLASLCGCSPRHFARMFHAHFGMSIRTKQTLSRMEKARQLLRDSDAKIIHVAMDCGFRHLGLFNAVFKRHLGMTPSVWRKKFGWARKARKDAA